MILLAHLKIPAELSLACVLLHRAVKNALKVTFCVSLLANFAIGFVVAKLWNVSIDNYKKELLVRLYPIQEIDFIPAWKSGQSLPKVLMIRDSRVEQGVNPARGAQILNWGKSSQTTSQILLRIEPKLKQIRSDFVVIEAGVNDLKAISLMAENRDQIIEKTINNLDKLVRFSQATGAKIIICTIFPAGPASFMDRLRWNSESETAVLEVNNYI